FKFSAGGEVVFYIIIDGFQVHLQGRFSLMSFMFVLFVLFVLIFGFLLMMMMVMMCIFKFFAIIEKVAQFYIKTGVFEVKRVIKTKNMICNLLIRLQLGSRGTLDSDFFRNSRNITVKVVTQISFIAR